jgi:hypothetical protein
MGWLDQDNFIFIGQDDRDTSEDDYGQQFKAQNKSYRPRIIDDKQQTKSQICINFFE